jgi:membrane protein
MIKQWRATWEFVVALVMRFREERVTQTAGSLTYTTLLALVPLLTVALAVSTAFPMFDDWITSLQLFVMENVLPDTPILGSIVDQVNSFAANAGRLTAIGIVGFIVTSVMLMLTVDNALNRIFRVQRRRSLLQNVFVYWSIISLGPLLIGASLSGTYVALRASLGALELDTLADAAFGVVPFLLTCAALILLYGIVPARRVVWRHAVLGGVLAGIGFEVAKRAFAVYLTQVPTYALIYGAFATVPIFLVWLYLSWLVVLTGAIVTAMLPAYSAKPERHRVQGEELAEALAMLTLLARAHAEGQVVHLNSLARRLRLVPERCEEMLERARAMHWVTRTDKDGWVLSRDPASIRLADVYRNFVFDADAVGVPQADLELSLRDYLGRASMEGEARGERPA